VNVDLETKKGNSENLARILNTPEMLTKLNDFIVNVLLDDEDSVQAAKYGGGAHVCFSYEDTCNQCKSGLAREWPHGHYVGLN